MSRTIFCGIRVASMALALAILMLSSSPSVVVVVSAFSPLQTSSSTATGSLSSLSSCYHFPSHHSVLRSSTDDDDESSSPWKNTDQESSPTQQWLEVLPKTWLPFRLSLCLMFSTALATTAISATGGVEPAIAATTNTVDYQEGISPITKSALGTSVRSTVVQSAKLVDAVDLKWERFSDSLRDKQKCDPRTNRRLFDNGIRSDGTPRGNPVLGALCEPVPLKEVDESLLKSVLDDALDSAAYETLLLGNDNNNLDRSALKVMVDQTRDRLEPVFARAISDGKPTKSSSSSEESLDEAKKRQRYNLEVFARVRAYGEASAKATQETLASPSSTTQTRSKAYYTRQTGRKLDLIWGRNMLEKLAGPSSASYEFKSPFPKPDPDIPLPYEADQLTNALGAIEKALNKLQEGGLIGHWEISIPEDDYGEVVTIAVDDDVCLGAQILAREENSSLTGSPVVAIVRSALEDRAKIPYAALDVFFIDPTTTKNELYNPTQLLVSLRNLGEEP